jgi:hypothetical protein
MRKLTSGVFQILGFDTRPAESVPFPATDSQARWFRMLRVAFGLIWLYNVWNISSGANKHAIARFLHLPFSSAAVHLAGTGIMFVALYLALALISGNGMRSALWIGTAYLLVMWIAVEHGGDFNPATGATDAGIAPPYLIALIITYLTWRMSQRCSISADGAGNDHTKSWIYVSRLMFGFLWAWDALFKLHPYFLTHMVDFISRAESGQPGWIIAYQRVWVAVITHTSPLCFAIITALTEAAIAWSLLSGKLLWLFLNVGLVFSLLIWSAAEGFGGPYGNGFTGTAGNMFGNAVIYALIFAYFLVLYHQPRRDKSTAQTA